MEKTLHKAIEEFEGGHFFASERLFKKVLQKNPGNLDANYFLGTLYAERNKPKQALFFLHRAAKLQPNSAYVHNNLGNVYYLLGMVAEAKNHFTKVLELDPTNGNVIHLLATIAGDQEKAAPRAYIEELFDSYAENFESHLASALEYRVPEMIAAILDQGLVRLPPAAKILDLGCGTGLLGQAIHHLHQNLVGVDLSRKMLAEAAKKKVYQELHCEEIATFLRQNTSPYDLIMAGDVFVYVGELGDILGLVGERLRPGGNFIFSTELLGEGDFSLQPHGRFAHSDQYIRELTARSGMKLVGFERINLRKHKGGWLVGGLYIVGKA